jgi:hypothetical protein
MSAHQIRNNVNFIPRASDPKKVQSKTARKLIIIYLDLIENSKSGIGFIRHDFISSLIKIKKDHISFLNREISNLFKIKYHYVVVIDGEKNYAGMTVELLERNRSI